MRLLPICRVVTPALILLATGAVTLAPAEAFAQASSMSEQLFVQQLEQRLDRIRRQASKMEKVVVKGWEPISKEKEDRYRNSLHEQLEDLQKKSRSEKRRLQSGSSGMFATQAERRVDHQNAVYAVQKMERQLEALSVQFERFQERQNPDAD